MAAVNTIGKSQQAAQLLGKSQTGMKLLQQAEAMGVKINFGGKGQDGVMGYFDPQQNSITVHAGSEEQMTEVLAHELFHAVTKGNGNSMAEEKAAFKLGEAVAEEAGVNKTKHDATYWDAHVDKAYKGEGLAADNGAQAALQQVLGGAGVNAALAGTNTGFNPVAAKQNYAKAKTADATPTGAAPTAAGLGGIDPAMILQLLMSMLTGGRTGQDQALNNQAFKPLQAINTFV